MPEIITIPTQNDTKTSYLHVESDGNLHSAWVTAEGKVLVYEYCPDHYPSATLGVFENIQEYLKAIFDVSWIMEGVPKGHEILKKYEFFCGSCDTPFYQESPTECPHCHSGNFIQTEGEPF